MGGLLHLVQRGGAWTGCGSAQSPPRCTKCHSPPINGQCTNFILFDVAQKLPLHYKGLMAIMCIYVHTFVDRTNEIGISPLLRLAISWIFFVFLNKIKELIKNVSTPKVDLVCYSLVLLLRALPQLA